jgi:hypothetical protein
VLRCSCCTRLVSPSMACVSSVVAAWADVLLEARCSCFAAPAVHIFTYMYYMYYMYRYRYIDG